MPIIARPSRPILPKRLAMVPGIGLSGYIRANRGMGRFRNRGLGQDETTLPPGVDTSNVPVTNPLGGYPVASPASAPNPFTTALAQSLPGLLSAWTTIGGRVIAPSVQYQGPGGVMYSAPAGSGGAAIPFLPGTTSSYLPLLLIGGGLLVVFLMMGKR